jgi:hypothetical protein
MVRRDRTLHKATWRGGLLLGTLGLVGCGSAMNIATVENEIKADIERQGRRLTLREVRCPDNVTPQEGAFMRCVGELDPEGTFTINVIYEDNQGNVTWEVPNSTVMLNLAKVEANIQEGLTKAFSRRALVDCGSELYRINQPGDRFECSIVGGLEVGSDAYNSVLVRVDPDGNLNWQEIRINNPTAALTMTPAQQSQAPSQGGTPTGASAPASPTSEPAGAEQSADSVKTTTVTGPSGRKIERPYIPGDDD